MAKPIKHRGKWRARWFDSHGVRQSEVHDEYRAALSAQRAHEAEVDAIKRGLRSPEPLDKTFSALCDLWIEKRVPRKRDGKNDKSMIKALREHFGEMRPPGST
jgi:hypothetical protein